MPISNSIFKSSDDDVSEDFDEVIGRFRLGYQTPTGRPVGLSEFRVTTVDHSTAVKVDELLEGGGVEEWETASGEPYQTFTSVDSVDVLLADAGAVRSSLVLWGRSAKIMESDGEFLIEDGVVTDKPDPDARLSLDERKKKSREGIGPSPSLQLYFRLADASELGKFKFFSSAWTALDNFAKLESQLKEVDETAFPVQAQFSIERVEFERDGQIIKYSKPVVKLL